MQINRHVNNECFRIGLRPIERKNIGRKIPLSAKSVK